MIDIKRKEDCVGCGACHDACPRDAIYWETDIEGFWYPRVNQDKCIECGLCEKVCPIIQSGKLNCTNAETPVPDVLAAYNADPEVRFKSTSGGIFSVLAEKMLADGGYICGAVWTEDFGAKHIISNRRENLLRIRGSKYFQSDMTGVYREIRSVLAKGEKVLVCGCPCQMAGLRAFLRKDYDNLLLVDFICCSINSPKLFKDTSRTWSGNMAQRWWSIIPRIRNMADGTSSLSRPHSRTGASMPRTARATSSRNASSVRT